MNTAKMILSIVSAAVLLWTASGCRSFRSAFSHPHRESLISSAQSIRSVCYSAEITTSMNAVFQCDAMMRRDGSVRRTFSWNEVGRKRSYTECIGPDDSFTVTDGKVDDSLDGEQKFTLLLFADMFLKPVEVRGEVEIIPGFLPGFDAERMKVNLPGFEDAELVIAKNHWYSLSMTRPDGSTIQVRFPEYTRSGDTVFPSKITTSFNGRENTAVLKEFSLNSILSDELFAKTSGIVTSNTIL